MIKIETLDRIDNISHIVIPTIFPDGSSNGYYSESATFEKVKNED